MHIHFNSDHVITNIGFKFIVSATPKDACYCSELTSISLTNVGESLLVSSPNHPNRYCPDLNCKWLITVPTNLGIELHWERFETEKDADFVSVYDGNQTHNVLKSKCSDKSCPSFTSTTTQVFAHFVSNNRNTTDIGFRFIARVVKNYCTLEALFLGVVPQLGTLTSTKAPRIDGNIPHEAVVTLVCPEHHKIANTVGQITSSATCLSPLWSNSLGTCIPACHLNFTSHYMPDDVHFCGFGENLVTQLVEQGHEITVSRYDHVNGNILIEKKKYMCIDADSWDEQPPICHPMVIAMFGGEDTFGRSIELYTPTDNIQTSEVLDLELLVAHHGHSAVAMPSGDVLVVSSESSSSLELQESIRMVERININTNSVTAVAQVLIARGGRAAAIDDTVYLCGGALSNDLSVTHYYRKACEVFQDGKWFPGVPMLIARNKFGMVAIGQSLYAIGGGSDLQSQTMFSAEKYSIENQNWTFIAPMISEHLPLGTAALEGSIYVCGNSPFDYLDSSCDTYSHQTNQWQTLSAKMIRNRRQNYCLVAFGGSLFAFGGEDRADDLPTSVEMYDKDTGKWTMVGNTETIRTQGAAVVIPYEGNIPTKENQTQVMNSKFNHLLNISALGHSKVITEKGAPLPDFGGQSDKATYGGTCTCETNMEIELMSLEESKTIESPGYPNGYCNYHRCLWTISAADSLENNLAVSLKWTAFSTENLMDMVYIYDQNGLLEVCTGSHCSNHKSSGNTLFVYFESDHVATDIGFKMVVTAMDPDPCYCSELSEVVLNSPDESYTIESPNYPESYCSNHHCAWHISVPEDHLIRINWKTFDLGQGHIFEIHGSNTGQIDALPKRCMKRYCGNLQTLANELYLEFSSNDYLSGSSNVFSALITIAHSYCKKLGTPPIGSVTYDKDRWVDGNLPIGTVAILLCPNGYKISDSLRNSNSNITCIGPDWSDKLKTCSQVCKIDPTFKSYHHTNICSFNDGIRTDLVPVGHEVTVKEYDFLADEMKDDSEQVFSCSNLGWSPKTPVCHRLAIVMYINVEQTGDYKYSFVKDNKSIFMLYYPLEQTTDVLETTLEVEQADVMTVLFDYPFFVASPLSDGSVLLSGEHLGSVSLNVFSGRITRLPDQVVGRRLAASAQLAGEVYVCGGRSGSFEDTKILNTCEVWRSDRWMELDALMDEERESLAMVATEDTIFVIGGIDANYNVLASVEKYSLHNESWQSVAPLEVAMYSAAAVYYNGIIMLCGGVPAIAGVKDDYVQSDKCYKYLITEDSWQEMASLHYKRSLFNMVVFTGRVYVLGGIYAQYPVDDLPVLAVESFDDETHEWSIEAELPDSFRNAISPSSVVVVNWGKLPVPVV